MTPLEALGIEGARFVHVAGAGGKSTLLAALAAAHAASGRRVVLTTSTRIREAEAAGPLVLACDAADLAPAVAAALARSEIVTVAGARLPAEGKLAGLEPEALAALAAARLADVVLVEADGSAGRPLKAHAAHEPVIAPAADRVVLVTGADALGRPATDAHVHRAALLRERLGVGEDHALTAADVAATVLHPGGALARVPAAAALVAVVRHDSGDSSLAAARAIAAALHAADRGRRLARVVLADTLAGRFEPVARPD